MLVRASSLLLRGVIGGIGDDRIIWSGRFQLGLLSQLFAACARAGQQHACGSLFALSDTHDACALVKYAHELFEEDVAEIEVALRVWIEMFTHIVQFLDHNGAVLGTTISELQLKTA